MNKQTGNKIKLGIFVVAGLVLLVTGLYIIGRNNSLFGAKYEYTVLFRNANGLMPGNNVRYSGINAGTVKTVKIVNDTTIEVVFYIDKKTRDFIRKNAVVSIGTEGLMGNKILNIEAGAGDAPHANPGDTLTGRSEASVNEIMETLYSTNDNVHAISAELLYTLRQLNESSALWAVLNDSTLPENIRVSLESIRRASGDIAGAAASLDDMLNDIEQGEGIAGMLLKDEEAKTQLSAAIANISNASSQADTLVTRLDDLIQDIQQNMDKSTAGLILSDTAAAASLNRSLQYIEDGTASFSENMEALKHNFLLRGYFKKKAKKEK